MKRNSFHLAASGWSENTRDRLLQVIAAGEGRGLPAVFDFDNTIICGDIGEAVFAMLVRTGRITVETLPPELIPPFRQEDGTLIHRDNILDPARYYEALLNPTMHGERDRMAYANAYAWVAEAMQGLRLSEVVSATRKVWRLSRSGKTPQLSTPGGARYPIPFLYPEMVELIAVLLRLEFDVWIVSASNVWSVRWVVEHALNPALAGQGAPKGIAPDRVVGIANLLSGPDEGLHKDAVVVKQSPGYACLERDALSGLVLTRWLQHPVPVYAGKVATIWDQLGRAPFLCCGDSPGDLGMMSFSRHRLWIDRVDKPGYRKALEECRARYRGEWLVQPVRTKQDPGFLPDHPELAVMETITAGAGGRTRRKQGGRKSA